jgi:small subunit ribosomal protein S13
MTFLRRLKRLLTCRKLLKQKSSLIKMALIVLFDFFLSGTDCRHRYTSRKAGRSCLTYIYGIGLTRAQSILDQTGVNPDIRVKDLDDADIQKLRVATEAFTIEGDLRRQEGMALKRLQDIGCLRGRRHRMSLPVRGQRTRTNARTRRGSRKTVAGRKK